MSNREKYISVFKDVFEIDENEVLKAMYSITDKWDSVGHMNFIYSLEEKFDIMIDIDDIVELNSFDKGIDILKKYKVEID